jgi:hypothetical protein
VPEGEVAVGIEDGMGVEYVAGDYVGAAEGLERLGKRLGSHGGGVSSYKISTGARATVRSQRQVAICLYRSEARKSFPEGDDHYVPHVSTVLWSWCVLAQQASLSS